MKKTKNSPYRDIERILLLSAGFLAGVLLNNAMQMSSTTDLATVKEKKLNSQSNTHENKNTITTKTDAPSLPPSPNETPSQTKFTFHSLLKKNSTEYTRPSLIDETLDDSHTKESTTHIDANTIKNNASTINDPQTHSEQLYVQIASFQHKKKAETYLSTLTQLPYPFQIEQKTLSTGDTWYRILAGPFKTKSEFSDLQRKIKELQ